MVGVSWRIDVWLNVTASL